MRKKILSIALAVMMAIPTMPVMAASDKDVLGDWYANIYGVGIQVTFRKGGSYLISMDGVNNGDPEEGTWKMTGDAITLDEGEENSMNLTVKGNSISADSGEFTLSREETEYDGYTPAKLVDADEKDFDGIWKADYVSTGNITAPVDVFGISGAFISVKSGKLELFLNSDAYEKPLDAEDLTVEFKDNACTFTSEKDEEKEAEKPGIVIARKVTITNKQNFFGVGKIGKIFKKDNEDKIANLKTIFAKGKEETLNDIAENVDPAIIEGVIELRKRNMLTEKQAQKAIINLATGSATKENLDFTIEYNMKDLSKWAFLPWNRGVRDQIAKVAEENRENEIAEFTDGVEYEPNPIKRMMARVKQKKLGNGKEKEDNVEEKTSKASNVFKKRIKDEAQKSDYEQLRDDIIAGKDVESLDEIIKKAKEATRTGKISTTELQNLMNNAETMKKDIASRENEESEEKKVIINDPQEMEK